MVTGIQQMAVPDWLTTEFIQSCLQGQEDQPIIVSSYTVEPGVPEGNNYGSQLLRVKVKYNKGNTNSSVSLIIKAPLTDVEDLFGDVYFKEATFYREFINQTYKYCKHELVPKHYISPKPNCTVLEDLSASEHVMVDRHNFLDLKHCQLFIRAKAKLHALSIAVNKTNPEIIESLVKESPASSENVEKMFKGMMKGSLQCMAMFLEDKLDCKKYLDFIKEALKNDSLFKVNMDVEQSMKKKSLKALTQLDPWCTNMMFKYNKFGVVESIKLLDFQSLALTSPVKELVTFLAICPNMEVRKSNLNSLYHFYCNELNENLAELKCPERLSFEELEAEIKALGPTALMLVLGFLPLMLSEGAVDMKTYFTEHSLDVPVRESLMYKLYQNEHYSKNCLQLLQFIDEQGVFDYLKEKIELMKC